MLDRTPTEVLANGAIRYGIYNADGTLNRYEYIKPEDAPTQDGTALNKANLLKDVTAAMYGLEAGAVPDEVFAEIHGGLMGSIIRDLNIMLNLSLGTSNIDAWADLLADASQINAVASSGYTLSGGKIVVSSESVGSAAYSGDQYFGNDSTQQYVGQTFIATLSGPVSSVVVQMLKVGSPTDNITMQIYASNKTTLLYTSDTTIVGSSLTTSVVNKTFNFTNANLVAGTEYFIAIKRSGAVNASNYYKMGYSTGGTSYAGGSFWYFNGSAWTSQSSDLVFTVAQKSSQAVVVWNAVTATEVFTKTAVAEDITLGTGTITFYVSDDGTNWTQITAFSAAQTVNFDATSVYLKAVITGNAELLSVAWGGY